MVALWGWREVEKLKAAQLIGQEDPGGQEILRYDLSPYPITPYKWHAVVEASTFYQPATVDTLRSVVRVDPADILYKPPTTPATEAAKRCWLGEVYLDWSQYPLVDEVAKGTDAPDKTLTTVTFRDLRFLYDVPFLSGRGRTPLEGRVTVQDGNRVVSMEMGDREQK
jgi:inner membrane protein